MCVQVVEKAKVAVKDKVSVSVCHPRHDLRCQVHSDLLEALIGAAFASGERRREGWVAAVELCFSLFKGDSDGITRPHHCILNSLQVKSGRNSGSFFAGVMPHVRRASFENASSG